MTAATGRIPLSEPVMGEREAAYLQQCIRENWVASRGRFVAAFEELFAQIHERPEAVSTISGTAALHVGLVELGVGAGDEVIVPAMTFAASAYAVCYCGATPVFADIDPRTFGLDAAAVQGRITPRTKAIMVVHLYGHPVDMDPILELADAHGLPVIEDATEALGSRYRGRLCGTLGAIACFSFNGNKVITSGGGGMVLAKDPERLRHIRHLTLQARVPGTREYIHDEVGFNYTLSNLQAAVGLAQLERLDDFVEARRRIFERYAAGLAGAPGLSFSVDAEWSDSNHWLMSVLTDDGAEREPVLQRLIEAGIEARPFFTALPSLAPFGGDASDFPVAGDLHSRGISIPSSASLDESAQDRVIDALLSAR
jgi:perosamine synthetase